MPTWIVLPRPTASASKSRGRSWCNASFTVSIWNFIGLNTPIPMRSGKTPVAGIWRSWASRNNLARRYPLELSCINCTLRGSTGSIVSSWVRKFDS